MADKTRGGSTVPASERGGDAEDAQRLGRPLGAHEPERPAIGESASQTWPGAVGEHANPIGPGIPKERAPVLAPGEAILPEKAPDMPKTGAFRGPHPPAPPYDGHERRVAQQDWDRWRAEDRRVRPFEYPDWKA